LKALRIWLSHAQLSMLGEGPGYFERLQKLTLAAKAKGWRVHDARVAAICLCHGVRELWTADRDFSVFAGLHCRNPLATTGPL
jgi:hypothetical protein